MTKQVKASEFEHNALAVLDEVAASGEAVVVTKNGKPFAKIVPQSENESAEKTSSLGMFKGEIKILGDIVSPTEPDWDPIK